jgi:hypothetical protein
MNARTTLVLAVMSLAVLAALLPALPDPAPLLAAAQDIAANLPMAGGLVR